MGLNIIEKLLLGFCAIVIGASFGGLRVEMARATGCDSSVIYSICWCDVQKNGAPTPGNCCYNNSLYSGSYQGWQYGVSTGTCGGLGCGTVQGMYNTFNYSATISNPISSTCG